MPNDNRAKIGIGANLTAISFTATLHRKKASTEENLNRHKKRKGSQKGNPNDENPYLNRGKADTNFTN
jgi:hypothetical protein